MRLHSSDTEFVCPSLVVMKHPPPPIVPYCMNTVRLMSMTVVIVSHHRTTRLVHYLANISLTATKTNLTVLQVVMKKFSSSNSVLHLEAIDAWEHFHRQSLSATIWKIKTTNSSDVDCLEKIVLLLLLNSGQPRQIAAEETSAQDKWCKDVLDAI